MHTSRKYQRRPRQEWQSLVEEFGTSGLSAPQFCEQHDVSYASFSKWRATFNSEDKVSPVAFVDITPTDSAQEPTPRDWAVELSIGDHLVLRIRQTV